MPAYNRPQDQEEKEGRIMPSAEQPEVEAHLRAYGRPEDEELSGKVFPAKDDEERDEPEVAGHIRAFGKPEDEKDGFHKAH